MKRIALVIICLAFLASSTFAFAADVYVTKNGKKYHKETCRWIKNRETTKMDEKEAIEKGYEPCSRCFKSKAVSDKSAQKAKEVVQKAKESKS